MKILLAYKSGRPGAGDYFARMMPVGLGWINATLRAERFDSRLANLSGLPWNKCEALLRRERPDLIGVTLYTFNRHQGLRLARLARKVNPGCVVIVGGPHATHTAASILTSYPDVTAVGIGEGEITMLEAARAIETGRPLSSVPGLMVRGADAKPVLTAARGTVADLDSLPYPGPHYRGLHLDVESETSFVITSRGCPARCTFCNTPEFWGTRMRFRGPKHMLEEMRFLRDRVGLLYVAIRDDTFTVHKRRVIEFCERLIDSRLDLLWSCQSRVNAIDEERLTWLRRAGCDHIQYGIESGSPRLLSWLAKDISIEEIRAAAAATRRVGLTLSIYLISGIPDERAQDVAATRELLEEILPHDGLVAPLAVFPGTHLYDAMKRRGEIDDSYWVVQKQDTLYCLPGRAGAKSFARLTALCRSLARRAAYTRADLERHKTLLPDSFATWLASAQAWEEAGDPGAALAEYDEILRFSPDNVWALARIGSLLARSGDPAGAALYLRRARRIVPRSTMLKQLAARSARSA